MKSKVAIQERIGVSCASSSTHAIYGSL
jgi:hypothetical protein